MQKKVDKSEEKKKYKKSKKINSRYDRQRKNQIEIENDLQKNHEIIMAFTHDNYQLNQNELEKKENNEVKDINVELNKEENICIFDGKSSDINIEKNNEEEEENKTFDFNKMILTQIQNNI